MTDTPIRVWGYEGSHLRIETATGELAGAWVPIPGEAEERLDFPTPAELCRGCGRFLLTSGSKFSIWFCDECRPRVDTLNNAAGRCVIPRGRHTLCNGIGTKPIRDWQSEDSDRFVDDLRGLWESMEVLARWAREIVRRNCAALDLDTQPTVALISYLDAAWEGGIPTEDAFAAMLDWWAEQPAP